jgi:hypothetical protein
MSLDVYLSLPAEVPPIQHSGIFVRRDGQTVEITREEWDMLYPGNEPVVYQPGDTIPSEVYWANITHNLTTMADRVDLSSCLWHPERVGVTHAKHLIAPLLEGLSLLKRRPEFCRQFNPPNGWGSYETFVSFVSHYLYACMTWPDAEVRVSR